MYGWVYNNPIRRTSQHLSRRRGEGRLTRSCFDEEGGGAGGGAGGGDGGGNIQSKLAVTDEGEVTARLLQCRIFGVDRRCPSKQREKRKTKAKKKDEREGEAEECSHPEDELDFRISRSQRRQLEERLRGSRRETAGLKQSKTRRPG
ncbi:hypothetical protein H101_06666 [Trichophyton interdigitale H6]|nr:hypothetical protein H101_06666 [Trichophyton interdigitale H6]